MRRPPPCGTMNCAKVSGGRRPSLQEPGLEPSQLQHIYFNIVLSKTDRLHIFKKFLLQRHSNKLVKPSCSCCILPPCPPAPSVYPQSHHGPPTLGRSSELRSSRRSCCLLRAPPPNSCFMAIKTRVYYETWRPIPHCYPPCWSQGLGTPERGLQSPPP